jgi:hypothetical protein
VPTDHAFAGLGWPAWGSSGQRGGVGQQQPQEGQRRGMADVRGGVELMQVNDRTR